MLHTYKSILHSLLEGMRTGLTRTIHNLAIIAAFLTIVGYSLNDTIVVFDRIRENLNRFRRRNFEEVFGNCRKIKQGKTYTVATAIRE